MSQSLTKSAQSVQDALDAKGIKCAVMELSESTRTANDAAAALKCTVGQIVKSLIFKTSSTGEPLLVLASGSNRVDEKILASFLGEKIEKADAAFVKDRTGFAIGGVPPVGHAQKMKEIFVDEDLLNFENVWAAAGTPNAVFEIQSKDLVDLTHGKIVSIK